MMRDRLIWQRKPGDKRVPAPIEDSTTWGPHITALLRAGEYVDVAGFVMFMPGAEAPAAGVPAVTRDDRQGELFA